MPRIIQYCPYYVQNNNVTVTDKLRKLVSVLGEAGRTTLNEAAAAELFALVRSHMKDYEGRHHIWAHRLGAQPTGFWGRAIRSMAKGADAKSGWVELKAPGIARAYHDITIRPRTKKALTIPKAAEAYGSSVPELQGSYDIFRPKKKDYLMGRSKTDAASDPVLLFLLRKQVKLKKDDTMLPQEKDIQRAALSGYKKEVRAILGGAK